MQKVDCAPGEVVDTHSFLCVECISPTYSRGGGARECDSCARGWYAQARGNGNWTLEESVSNCLTCPEGATCVGGDAMPRAKAHYFQFDSRCPDVYGCALSGGTQHRPDSAYCEGWTSNSSAAGTSTCGKGATGPLCSYCENGWWLNSPERKCFKCSSPAGEFDHKRPELWVHVLVCAVLLGQLGFMIYAEELDLRFPPSTHRWVESEGRYRAFDDRGRRTCRRATLLMGDRGGLLRGAGLTLYNSCMTLPKYLLRDTANTQTIFAILKIIMTALQIILFTASSIPNVDFPPMFQRLRKSLAFFSFELNLSYGQCGGLPKWMTCDGSYCQKTAIIITTLLPYALFVAVFCLIRVMKFLTAKFVEVKYANDDDDNNDHRMMGGESSTIFRPKEIERTDSMKNAIDKLSMLGWRGMWRWIERVYLLLAFLFLPALSSAVFSVFECMTFVTSCNSDETEETKFLSSDFRIECSNDNADWTFMRFWFWFALLSPLGGPAGTAAIVLFILMTNYDAIRNPPGKDEGQQLENRANDERLAGKELIFAPYKMTFWAFEVYEIGRRMLMTGFLKIFSSGTRMVVANMLAFCSVVVRLCIARV